MPHIDRSYIAYIDDSGTDESGLIWSALVIPFELWTEYLGRWLAFRAALFKETGVPADWELHAVHWLSPRPTRSVKAQTQQDQVLQTLQTRGLPAILTPRDKTQRRERSRWYEKGLRRIGTFTEARVLTVHGTDPSGVGKVDLYNELLCFLEEMMFADKGRTLVIVDGADELDRSYRASHRALRIQRRRVLEDPAFRGADDSQLLQMADFCAHAAHRSVVNDPQRAPQFNTAYQTHLNAIIERPVVVPAVTGRAIRGLDYIATHSAHCVNRWPSMHP
jgi:hypothetical protein